MFRIAKNSSPAALKRLDDAALAVTAAISFAEVANARPLQLPSAPMSRPISVMTPANAWQAGASQPYQRYSNSGIGAANCWNAGCNQPYTRYPNAGITPANCSFGGCNQPYNQYHNAINP